MQSLSVIVIAKNAASEIVTALKTASFATEIILVDTGSIDDTIKKARPFVSKVIKVPSTPQNFSAWRNKGAKAASGDWLLYLDSDERLSQSLIDEITRTINSPTHAAYTIHRHEILLGQHLAHWGDSRVLRLIKRSDLVRWQGRLHEQPKIKGTIGHLRHSMIQKTLHWSKLEGQLLYTANHPKMSSWRFFRIILTEFFSRFIKQGLWRDGTVGALESIYQSYSRFLSYARLWELQQDPSLKTIYQDIDKKILKSQANN